MDMPETLTARMLFPRGSKAELIFTTETQTFSFRINNGSGWFDVAQDFDPCKEDGKAEVDLIIGMINPINFLKMINLIQGLYKKAQLMILEEAKRELIRIAKRMQGGF